MRLDDPERLGSIKDLRLVDSPPEDSFDRVTRLASRLLGAPVSLVSIVTDDRQFFKSQVGLPEPWSSKRETPLSHSFCQHVVRGESPFVVRDAREHELVRDNLAIDDIDVIAYCGVPIRDSDGRVLGSFCVIDSDPRDWTDDEIALVADLVEVVHDELRLRALLRERGEAVDDLKNLLATIAHDLKGPLATVAGVIEMLQERGDALAEARRDELLAMARRSSERAARMADQLVRSQQPSGTSRVDVGALLDEVAAAATTGQPDQAGRVVVTEVDDVMVIASADHLERIVGNLVANGLAHAGDRARITLSARRSGDEVVIVVADDGVGMTHEQMEDLRKPFHRGEDAEARPGFGLGLHIVWALVEEVGGRVKVATAPGEGVRFEVSLPADPRKAAEPSP